MNKNKEKKIRFLSEFHPWLFIGATIVLFPIFSYITIDNIFRHTQSSINTLLEKGAALVRSFEAGTRTGLLAGAGETLRLQKLLFETAQQPDIEYLFVANTSGKIIAHSNPAHTGRTLDFQNQENKLDLKKIASTKNLYWQIITNAEGKKLLILFRKFSPSGSHKSIRLKIFQYNKSVLSNQKLMNFSTPERIIFVGLDMSSVEAARKIDIRDSIITGIILLMAGIAGIILLFMIQGYQSTKTSLSRIKVFSDTVVENMPIGLVTLDKDKKPVSTNQVAKSILGLPIKSDGKTNNEDFLPEDLLTIISELNREHYLVEKEIECQMQSGIHVPLEISAAILTDEEDQAIGYICLIKDLSEVRSLKKEIERSQRLASVGKLAAGVAHEIRNPLSSIKGFATYFKERSENSPEDKNISEIMIQETDRMNRVIGQLLEFARPVTISLKKIEIKPYILNSLKLVEMQASKSNVILDAKFNDACNTISIDPDKLSQVLLNLYLNSIEAMEEGGRLSVDVKCPGSAEELKIEISDSGTGICKEDLAHIFDPYFTTKSSGTGLGLAISYNIIEAHKGSIQIDSSLGKGTTITIRLPQATIPDDKKK